MSARAQVQSVLALAMPPGVDVIGYARQIDAPSKPTVMVRIDEVTRPAGLPQGCRAYKFALVLIAALTDPGGSADDELDGLLEDVLHAVDTGTDLTWESASRAVYNDTNPAYEVSLTVHTIKEIPS